MMWDFKHARFKWVSARGVKVVQIVDVQILLTEQRNFFLRNVRMYQLSSLHLVPSSQYHLCTHFYSCFFTNIFHI